MPYTALYNVLRKVTRDQSGSGTQRNRGSSRSNDHLAAENTSRPGSANDFMRAAFNGTSLDSFLRSSQFKADKGTIVLVIS